MNSPFPGMDPHIEACGLWEDFHSHLIERVYAELAEAVPDRYLVRTGERSYVVLAEAEGKESHPFLANVGVTAPPESSLSSPQTAVAKPTTDTEAVAMRAFIAAEFRETFIEIYEAVPEKRLVTCIEVLSPSNKRRGSPGWELYLRKRQALLLGQANLVEIDLLRGGTKAPMLDSWPDSPYTLLVARRERTPYCRVWRGHFRAALPAIPVPLLHPDPDISLAIQPMIHAIYARSRYHRDIDYAQPLQPPISAADAAWLAEQLRMRQTQAS